MEEKTSNGQQNLRVKLGEQYRKIHAGHLALSDLVLDKLFIIEVCKNES